MSEIGFVSRTPPLTVQEVEVAALSAMEFVRKSAREIINPFTDKPAIIHPSAGEFDIAIAGVVMGGIAPSNEFVQDGEILIYGEPNNEELIRIVTAFATRLSANIEWFENPE